MTAHLTRTVAFRAEHHYRVPEWSEEENQRMFGRLTAPHTHDYHCAVTVSGPLDGRTGMLLDLGLLDRILEEEILRPLSGRHLNRAIAEFGDGGILPTCEALAAYLSRRIGPRLPPGVRLTRIRVEEDPTLHGEWTAGE